MPEILEINQMLANNYEPKRKFEWYLEIDGLDAFVAKSFARPNKEHEDITIDYINEKRHLAGKREWQMLTLELNDPIEPSAAQKVMSWLRLVHDDATGRMGYSAVYKKDISLKMLDPHGAVVEKWNLQGVWPKTTNFNELDYSDSEAVTITIELRIDRCFLEF
jgi:hypothetical protein